MKISEIIRDKYKLRIPPTVYYELLADVVEAEEGQDPFKPMVEIDLDYVIKQKYIEREVLDKISVEIQENINYNKKMNYQGIVAGLLLTLDIIDKYKAEIEPQENEEV